MSVSVGVVSQAPIGTPSQMGGQAGFHGFGAQVGSSVLTGLSASAGTAMLRAGMTISAPTAATFAILRSTADLVVPPIDHSFCGFTPRDGCRHTPKRLYAQYLCYWRAGTNFTDQRSANMSRHQF
ncbi:hypothetical protein AWC26_00625 [Mycobacterium shimoidei]|nr:hypothetical protein BHQ16_06845 [Mycobacterium shimoidei]ORW83958.1 hypothetical protein AWC26_00625 [Mycobacterium shimoidei]